MGHHTIQNIHGKVPNDTVNAGGQRKKAPGTYIKWDADGVETIQTGEKEKIQEVSDQFNRFQMMDFNEHMHCLRGTQRNWNDLPKFGDELSKLAAMPEYSQSAYGVFPLSKEQETLSTSELKDSDPINPVNDIGVEWDHKKYPFEKIATLEFEPQDSWLPEFRALWDDRIAVNSWHGLKEHQPLGSTNRMRRVVYAESRKLRLRINGYRDYVEPGGIAEVPVPWPAPQLAMKYQDAVQTVEVA
ncbi:hypothetical protein GQ44DRAFT_829308 [Phaeosphaeriaceae sp. PMI808]|nr:hypothetical protein GQ44DRAFT_829308 [Phaeosphaeriaceae sp. PMI808]